ncbi:hypothetical protein Trydic_g19490, partial [Trypoxylus dichotomus]
QRLPPEREKWDVFDDPPVMEASGSMEKTKWVDLGEKMAKIAAYVFTFALILSGAVISKGTLMFMAAQLTSKERGYCNYELDRHKEFVLTLPRIERIAWTWIIAFAFVIPQLGTFLRSARKLIYKSWDKPKAIIFVLVFISESLMTIGVAIFVYVVLPNIDSDKGLMLTNAVCFVPAVLAFVGNITRKLSNIEFQNDPYSTTVLILDLLSMLAQTSAFISWPITQGDNTLWFVVASAVMISCGWWENFAPLRPEYQRMTRFENSRYFIYIFVSLWKCVVFFVSMLVIEWAKDGEIMHMFTHFTESFGNHQINVTELVPVHRGGSSLLSKVIEPATIATITTAGFTPVWVLLINIVSTYICYVVGKWACKINIQGFSYSFPINLTVPMGLCVVLAICGLYENDNCTFRHIVPPHLFFNLPSIFELSTFFAQRQSWIWFIWLLSQSWITRHTWLPKCNTLATTEKLFVRAMYEPFLIDQDLALNRRVDDGTDWREEAEDDDFAEDLEEMKSKPIDYASLQPHDSVARIYACATMWHETKEEMLEFLKSIFRLDEDQCARRIVRDELGIELSDYYELETHIFFDDAFVRESLDDPDPQINDFVKTLITSIDEAASIVHEVYVRLRPPKKIITPYGGKLIWELPGKTKMVAHLKDKKKIRAKKRWSQVMYMYYILGHELMERDDISNYRKAVISENTFLLALDGDIDFQPKAVHLLVELMKKNKTLGAACGRIHPLGSGPMIWYQIFEYAVGHWLQKATEHVIGCVLCSPGCFSLFRGKALMDDSVMRKYTIKSSEARHYVQYDQGEDRWLCTLLLQRGYRVEYAAASDAFTHCPEGFNEFYNQRRRWMPSTTANIIDLLTSAKRTIRINDNISTGYIWYQTLLLFGTILGPGTIFLMLVSACATVFNWSQFTSFLFNVVPLLVFILTCITVREDKIQLFVAGALSCAYSFLMMAVLIGVTLQINKDTWLSPSSLFFSCTLVGYTITAFLHLKEIHCFKYGLVYYVTIPSMYMLLVIYSVFNMNNVSWGTREVTVAAKPQSKYEMDKKRNLIINWCGERPGGTRSLFIFRIATVFRCFWCSNADKSEDDQLEIINQLLKTIHERLDRIERTNGLNQLDLQRKSCKTVIVTGDGTIVKGDLQSMNKGRPRNSTSSVSSDYTTENSWLEDDVLRRGDVETLSRKEEEFWYGLLDKYLYPIDDSKDKVCIKFDMLITFLMLDCCHI